MGWREQLGQLLYPQKCALCGKVVPSGQDFCTACGKKLPLVNGTLREGPWGCCAGALYYEEEVRQAIHAFKFGGQEWRARPFGRLMAQVAAEEFGGQFDVVTWAPVSRRRLRERGYDQSRLLAAEMCRLWDTEPQRLLNKVVDNPAQSSLEGEAARRGNVLGVYAPACSARGKRILLVDDILTTGSTLTECVRTLQLAGAESVVSVTLAFSKKKT